MKAIEILKDEKILDLFVKEFHKKIAGEDDTIKAIFLHLICAKVKNNNMKTHIFVNSESSAGKSYICKSMIEIFPKDMYEYKTKITPEALTYWKHNDKEWTWDGKILYLEDVREDVVNSPTFKVMASEGTDAAVVKDQKTIEIKINGSPIMMITAANVYATDEIVNRFAIINLDETPEQTKRIMEKQIHDAINGGNMPYDINFTEAINMLKPCKVFIPKWINKIINHFPTDNIRIRRDFPRFLNIIKASAVLHQYQREFDENAGIVFADEKDYNIAREIIRKIDDAGGNYGLTHRLKRCYESCKKYFKEYEKYFTVKEIFSYDPIVSQRQWARNLEILSQKGLLKVNLRKPPEGSNTKKPSTEFYPAMISKNDLPNFAELV